MGSRRAARKFCPLDDVRNLLDRLQAKAVPEGLGFVIRSTDEPGHQVLDSPLQHGVGLDADGVRVAFILRMRTTPDWLGQRHRERTLECSSGHAVR